MIVWRGRGILVLVFAAVALILTQMFFDGAYGKGYYTAHGFPKFLAGVIAAIPIWFLGKKWNDESERRHDLFFVPMQYWSFIILALMLWTAMSPSSATVKPAASAASVEAAEPAPAQPVKEQAPVVAAAAIPTTPPPPPAAQPSPAPSSERPAFAAPTIKHVYADNASHQYYPENCSGRPEKAYRIARSVAKAQGYTLAAGCKE